MEATENPKPRLVKSTRTSQPESAQRTIGSRSRPDDPAVAKALALSKHVARLEELLKYEGALRTPTTLRELTYFIANETRKCVTARQVYVLRVEQGKKRKPRIEAVSNISELDRNAPMVRWLQTIFANALQQSRTRETDAKAGPFAFQFNDAPPDGGAVFPFSNGHLVPLYDRSNRAFAAIVLVGEKPLSEHEVAVLERLQIAWVHAWLGIKPRPLPRIRSSFRKILMQLAVIAALLALFIPLPLTALAPVEVVARQPQIVAAPIDGVVDRIVVEPNTSVEAGTILFRYIDTELAAAASLAERNRAVALARLQTARQGAFGSGNGARDMAVAEAELELADAELLFAKRQLEKTIVKAPVDGVVVFDRKTDWQGRPVSVGERVVEIADPSAVEYRVDLPVSDSIVLAPEARIKVFLDASPLAPKEALLATSNYQASLSAADQLVFKLYARRANDEEEPPRIGARGTAQVFGEKVSLGFYLFRRPLSVIRQYTGW